MNTDYGKYYDDGKVKIILTACNNLKSFALKHIYENAYIFFFSYWFNSDPDPASYIDLDKLIVCRNSIAECKTPSPYRTILLHHNIWINENLFTLQDLEKTYDAILVARPITWKRGHLASKVNNLALVAGKTFPEWDKDNRVDFNTIPHKYLNDADKGDPLLTAQQLSVLYNQSHCGLVLSPIEGGSYCTSEYLLNGLPVVSTKSLGGRDFYYNDFNHLICEATEDSVKECVEKFVYGKVDREKIRQSCIDLITRDRQRFIKMTSVIFKKNNISIDADKYFCDKISNNKETKTYFLHETRYSYDEVINPMNKYMVTKIF